MRQRLTGLASVLLAGTVLVMPSAALAYTQSPMLDAAVEAGDLPPVDERLPAQPEVVEVLESTGNYGGNLRNAIRAGGDHNAILRIVGNQGLTRWDKDFTAALPNLAESWEANAQATEYVFKLRQGTRWSDGEPFTADDIVFAMNDLVGNAEFFPSPPALYMAGGELGKVEKVDDYTVKFTFAAPYRTFPEELATPLGQHVTLFAQHYCEQFHPDFNADVPGLVTENRVDDWGALMRLKCGDIEVPTRWGNLDRPTLDPWVLSEPYSGGATRVVLTRNPYFWQVDTEGQQLPYIDTVTLPMISEIESIVLAAIDGQLDFQARHIDAIQNLPVLKENEARGNYAVFTLQDVRSNAMGMHLNMTVKNQELRDLFRNKDFRIALSHATDRQEVNDIVFLGQGTPWQVGPLERNRFYNEQLATQYLEYDPDQANDLLDGIGLTERDGEGYRLLPSGAPLTVGVIVGLDKPFQIEGLEIMRQQWQRVGVNLIIESMERSLFYSRAQNNEYDISVDVTPGGLDPTQAPRGFVAVHALDARQSLEWAKWYLSKGAQGEEPTESMKKRFDLYDAWRAAPTAEEADALFAELLQEAADAFEIIGVVAPTPTLAIRNVKLRNVYAGMPNAWSYATPGPSLPQQYYFEQ